MRSKDYRMMPTNSEQFKVSLRLTVPQSYIISNWIKGRKKQIKFTVVHISMSVPKKLAK